MMPAFQLQIQAPKHVRHSMDLALHLGYLRKVALQVHVPTVVLPQFYALHLGLRAQTRADIPVSACHEHKVALLEVRTAMKPVIKLI